MRTVKETSDELLPSAEATTPAYIEAPPRARRNLLDYFALVIATCGVGFVPIAPGTWGSLIGISLYVAVREAVLRVHADASEGSLVVLQFEHLRVTLLLALVFALTLIGVWAATRVEPLLGRKDPGAVVIDEVVGQFATFLFVPFELGWKWLVCGFILFRVFDMWKPHPIRRLEFLESGLGIMADDILAGMYAAALMALLTLVYFML